MVNLPLSGRRLALVRRFLSFTLVASLLLVLAPPQRVTLAQKGAKRLPPAAVSKQLPSKRISIQTSPPVPSPATFSSGNIVVYRVGTGAAALSSNATAVFLDEYTTSGTLVQSIALPTADSGGNQTLTASGTATSEGLLTRSVDGQYLLLTGYDAAPGTASITGSTSASVNRIIGRVDTTGAVNTTTALTDASTGSNPRSAVSTNGSDLWITGGAGGPRYTTLGSTTSTQISTTTTNLRQVNIFGGQLYVSSASGATRVATVGTGTPTTTGQTITNLPGIDGTNVTGPYAFFFADLNAGVAGNDTLYIADEGANQLKKFSLVSGTWTANGTVSSTAVRGITGTVSGSNVTLYLTSNGTTISTLTDASGYNATITGTPSTIVTNPTNTAFRGIALAPVPAADAAPTVNSTTPANLATGVALNANISITFSEPVNVTGSWFGISCATSGSHTAAVTGGPTTFTLNPDSDFVNSEQCTVTVTAAQVTDQDANDPPDTMAADYVFSFNTVSATPNLSINDVSQDEGNAGTTNFNFTVTLNSPAQTGGVSFTVNTADGTAQDDNPATEDNDYVAIVNGAGSIPEGSSSTQVTVQVNGDATPEPNETFSVNISGVTGANVTDGQGQGTIQNDDFVITPIHDIQGNGSASPIVGQAVNTTGIVTGIKLGSSGGFFIQDPTADADPNTSEGIFVFTGASVPAGAVVGNLVRVAGTVQEFVFSSDPNSPPITELSSVTSTAVISIGNPLPTPHTITAAETTAPSGTSNPLDSLEEFEGMRVTVSSLTVTGPTLGTITESSATVASTGIFYGVVTGVARPFREAGVNISDTLPAGSPANVPRFDENPERIRVDSDGQPGTTAINVSASTTVSNVTGPLDYQFRAYTILPDATLTGTNTGATPAPTPNADEFTVASFNMERFFDTSNDPNTSDAVLTATAFNNRLNKASLIIRNVQRYPDVIGVQEVENLSTLQAVASKINTDAVNLDSLPNPNYVAYLSEGNDIGGIDVGFLVKESRVTTVDVTQIEQPGCDHETPSTCNNYTNPNDGTLDILNDRPPLVLRATVNRPAGGTVAFTVINNHLRSLNNVDDPTVQGSGTVGARVRMKRQKGAEFLANYIQSRQAADSTEKIITVGDLNAFRANDGYADVIGTILGTPSPDDQTVVPGDGADLVNPNQLDLVDTLAADQRYSFTFDGNAQTLDHVIVNPNARSILTRFAYARPDADQPLKDYEDPNVPDRISDHDQPVAYFSLGVPQPAGSLVISEFRFRGPGSEGIGDVRPIPRIGVGKRVPAEVATPQDTDEFVEFYNNTNSDITVATLDGSAGWALVASDGVTRFIIPNGTVIPARRHFLAAHDGYSLDAYATPDEIILPSNLDPDPRPTRYSEEIPDGSGIAIFSTADAAYFTLDHRLDAAGYATVPSLYREGVGFPATGAEASSDLEYSFVRKVCVFGGVGCGGPGLPKDTADNTADFVVVNTVAAETTMGARLGAPGPQGLTSPVNGNAGIPGALLDTSVSSSQPPNRVREFGMHSSGNGNLGTLSIRRTVTNNTGAAVRYLAFRIIDITTNPVPSGTADLRALDSSDIMVTVNGNPVDVRGTTVEQPPSQPNGGGLNSTMAVGFINLANQLEDGESISIQFLLGIQQTGGYRFYLNVEMLNDGPAPAGPVSLGSRNLKKLGQEQQQRRRPRLGSK